jgi:hypothetical protein
MDKIQQNLDNIEKYLMVAQMENTKLNSGVKSSSPRLRSYLQNISKECANARKATLEKSKSMPVAKTTTMRKKDTVSLPASEMPSAVLEASFMPGVTEQKKDVAPLTIAKKRGRKPKPKQFELVK